MNWKNGEVISMGYKPVAPGICTKIKMTQMPLPICCKVVDSVSWIARYVSDASTAVRRNSATDSHCTPMARHPMQHTIACSDTIPPKNR